MTTCPQTPWSTSLDPQPGTWWCACCIWSGRSRFQNPGACGPRAAGSQKACTAAVGARARWRTAERRGQRAPPRARRSTGCSQNRGGSGGSCTCSASAGTGQSCCTWCVQAWKCVSIRRPSACRSCGGHGSCAPGVGWGSQAWVGYWSPTRHTGVTGDFLDQRCFLGGSSHRLLGPSDSTQIHLLENCFHRDVRRVFLLQHNTVLKRDHTITVTGMHALHMHADKILRNGYFCTCISLYSWRQDPKRRGTGPCDTGRHSGGIALWSKSYIFSRSIFPRGPFLSESECCNQWWCRYILKLT